jgi:hypothetical protein
MGHHLIRTLMIVLIAAGWLLTSSYAFAALNGEASVEMRIFNDPVPTTQSVPMPWFETQYQTPPMDLLYSYAPAGATMYSSATIGVDLPFGILTAWMSLFARLETPGTVVLSPKAWGSVRFEEDLQVQSGTLAIGTPVDVHLYARLVYHAVGSASGVSSSFGPNTVTAKIEGYRLPLVPGTGTGFTFYGNPAGIGEFDFGDSKFQAFVGDTVRVKFYLWEVKPHIGAAAYYDSQDHKVKPGQANATISVALAFGAEATAVSGTTTVRAMGAAQSGGDIVLYSTTLGGAFPGLNALDPANLAAHLPALTHPPTLAVAIISLQVLAGMSGDYPSTMMALNGEGRICLADVISGLQKLAELR